MQDLCKYNLADDRPISPSKDYLADAEAREKEERQVKREKQLASRNLTRFKDFGNRNKLNSSSISNVGIKEMVKRDKKLAQERKKKLETARSIKHISPRYDMGRTFSPTSDMIKNNNNKMNSEFGSDAKKDPSETFSRARDSKYDNSEYCNTRHSTQKKYYRQEDLIETNKFT
jgi:hypothetical protein